MKTLKSVLLAAVIISMAVPAYARIQPSNSSFITRHNSTKVSIAADSDLPVSYDLRDYGRVPPIREQNPWGTCWAFAALSSVESNYLTRLLSDDERAKVANFAGELADSRDVNFSPLHLAWFAKNDADRTRAIFTNADTEEKAWANSMSGTDSGAIFEGGFPNVSLAYFTRLDGPILETDMPYFSYEFINEMGYSKDIWLTLKQANACPLYREFYSLAILKKVVSPDKIPSVSNTANIAGEKFNVKLRLTDALFGSKVTTGIVIGARDDIAATEEVLRPDRAMTKRLIMQYGAVEMCYLATHNEAYLNRNTHAFYYDEENNVSVNHAVAIIGWDDNYPKENFNEAHRPKINGAWLVRNNWNTDWPNPEDKVTGNPDGGYFWLTYEQPIQMTLAYIVEDMPENIRVYEHDPMGYCKEAGYKDNKTAWAANAFKVKSSGEKLEGISFYTTDSNTKVEWTIYTQKDRPAVTPYDDTAQRILSGSDTFEYPGYHTVKFSGADQKSLTKGEYFTVVLKFTNSEYYCPVAVEVKIKGYSNFAAVHDFESWFSADGENWEDGISTYLEETDSTTGTVTLTQTPMNACIKAFTIDDNPSDSEAEPVKDLIMYKLVNDFPASTKANISVPDRPVSERLVIAVKSVNAENGKPTAYFDDGTEITFYLVNKDIASIYVSSRDTTVPNEMGLLQLDSVEYKSLFENGYEPDEYWKTSSDKFKVYGVEYPVYGPFVCTATMKAFSLNVNQLEYGGSSIKDDGMWGAIPDGTYDVIFFESSDANPFKACITLQLAGTTPKTAGMVKNAELTGESLNKMRVSLGLASSDYIWFVPNGMWNGANNIDDLTDAQKNLIPSTQTIQLALPTLAVTEAAANFYYVFAIPRNILTNAQLVEGDKIFLHLLPANDSEVELSAESENYKFFDADGNVLTSVPAEGDINVAVYLEKGTYIPVITTSTSEADDGDKESSQYSGGGSSGCNIGLNAALIMLAGISLMNFRKKIR